MCRLYAVTRAGYYAWRSRERSERERQDEALACEVGKVHAQSGGTYGSPRVHRALRGRGHRVGENRVARLMSRHGIKARVATLRYSHPGMQRYYAGPRNEQLDLELSAPDQVWVADITYLKMGGIYRYLAMVMDKYSRRIVGWSFGPRKDVSLTLGALNSAVRRRRPGSALVFHTDRGLEYGATAFRERLAELGFRQSMNRPGRMTDNAFIESFFHSMKTEIYNGVRFASDEELRIALQRYVSFYNQERLHSSLHYVSPATFERQARAAGCQ
jgi:transposase InsO family protein